MTSFDGQHKISKDEFLAGLRDINVLLPKAEASKLTQHFDKDIDGCINFNDFLIHLRGIPNEKRIHLIDIVFAKFDIDYSGYVDQRDLK
jgi:Ca2+-binding EF-hand superfamily protein